jgi:hypothetical protein
MKQVTVRIYRYSELSDEAKTAAMTDIKFNQLKYIIKRDQQSVINDYARYLIDLGFSKCRILDKDRQIIIRCDNVNILKVCKSLKIYIDKSNKALVKSLSDIEIGEFTDPLSHETPRYVISYAHATREKLPSPKIQEDEAVIMYEIIISLRACANLIRTKVDRVFKMYTDHEILKYIIDHDLHFYADGHYCSSK